LKGAKMSLKTIGGLWIKEGKKGKFFSGNITLNYGTPEEIKLNIMIFKNDKKEKENQPEYKIVTKVDDEP